MVEANILTENDRVELLAGQIVEQVPINPPHAATVRRLQRTFTRVLADGEFDYRTENPITLPGNSEPEPDFCIVRWRDDDYATAHPGAPDIALVIEVADTTLVRDRGSKLAIYAAAGIGEYWIFNLVDRQLERYTEPVPEIPAIGRPATYARSEVFPDGGRLEHPAFGEIVTGDLLPSLPPHRDGRRT